MKTWHYIVIVLGVILVIAAPMLFTRAWFPSCCYFGNTGEIGDTIGGTTAPIVGLISIFLLVWTLKSQLDFNKTQAYDNKISQIISLQNTIKDTANAIVVPYWNDDVSNVILEINGVYRINILSDVKNHVAKANLDAAKVQVGLLYSLLFEYYGLISKSDLGQPMTNDLLFFCYDYLKIVHDFYQNIGDGIITHDIDPLDKMDVDNMFMPEKDKSIYQHRAQNIKILLDNVRSGFIDTLKKPHTIKV